jgi:hypothetical protein
MEGKPMTLTRARRATALTAVAVTAVGGAALSLGAAPAFGSVRANTHLAVHTSARAISPGGSDVITGRLAHRGHGLAGRTVVLKDRAAGTTGFVTDGTATTGPHGRVTFTVTPSVRTVYRLVFAGGEALRPSTSRPVVVRVRAAGLTISTAAKSIEPGDSDSVSGVLTDKGTPVSGATVKLRDHVVGSRRGGFALVATATTGTDGSVTFPVSPTVNTRYVRSKIATVHVRRTSSLSIRLKDSSISPETSAIISGQLRGAHKGLAGREVTLQDRPSGSSTWTDVAHHRTKKAGMVHFAPVPPTASEDYQLVFAGGVNYDGCQSGVVTVTVS